jgi:hypothetical protein
LRRRGRAEEFERHCVGHREDQLNVDDCPDDSPSAREALGLESGTADIVKSL